MANRRLGRGLVGKLKVGIAKDRKARVLAAAAHDHGAHAERLMRPQDVQLDGHALTFANHNLDLLKGQWLPVPNFLVLSDTL